MSKSKMVETYEKDSPKHGHGFRVKRLVSAFFRWFVPTLFGFGVNMAIWVFFGKAMLSLGWITHPAWWMVYGLFVGNTAWWAASRCNRNMRRDIDNFFSR